MSIEQFQHNVNESQQRLNQFLALLDTGHEQGIVAKGELDGRTAQLQETTVQLNTRFQAVTELAEGVDVEQEANGVAGSLSKLSETAERGGSDLANEGDQFNASADSAREGMTGSMESLTSALEHLNSQLEEASQQLGEVQAKVQQSTEAEQQAIGQIGEAVATFESTLTERAETVAAALAALVSETDQSHLATMEQLFDSLEEVVESRLQGEVVESIESFGEQLGELMEDFDGEVDGLGEQLSERVGEIFDSLKEYVQTEGQEAVRDSLEQLMQEIVAAFAAEIVQAIVMTQVGVATTSSLSVMLPYIATAKKLLELINEAMSLIPG